MYQGKIAVTVDELTNDDGSSAVMNLNNYKVLTQRKRIVVLRRGCNCTPALVEFDSMPERFRKAYIEKYGDPKQMMRDDKPHLAMNEAAREYYAGLILADGKHLSPEKIDEYTLNASVLDLLHEGLIEQRVGRKRLGNTTPVSWESIWETSEELRRAFGHTLPASKESLRRKLDEYIKGSFEILNIRHHSHRLCNRVAESRDGVVLRKILKEVICRDITIVFGK